MVILRHGGVYADVDTECGSPLDDIILPDDTFLAGWEDEYASVDAAIYFKFSRQRQLLQWVFAATPGHPALLVSPAPHWIPHEQAPGCDKGCMLTDWPQLEA